MGHPIYHLEASVERCRVEIRLNDFPVLSLRGGDAPAYFAPPINPWLVGELNIVDVTILPARPRDVFGDARFSGSVRRFEKGGIVHPGAGEEVALLGVPDELLERAREEEIALPQSFSHVFANDVIDCSAELTDAPAFDDPEALRDYAVQLRDQVRRGDVSALLAEHEPKIHAWVHAYDEPYDAFAESLREELAAFIRAGDEEPFERADVELVPHCAHRIWELRRAGGPLLQTVPDAEGATRQLPIFVAPREGQLRVVR